ncbi:MAG: sialidase family protein, partial [Candidatus Lutacidiplasmatales archaeon]
MTDRLRRASLRWGILPVLVLVTLMAVPALPLSFASSHPGVPAGYSLSATMASAPRPATPVAAAPHPSAGGSSTFFTNTQIPLPANRTCFHGTGASGCANITNEPSINYTSTGVLAVAYTAMTNASPCANASGSAQSEIGFVRSTNLGASWSTPTYLGNTQCASGPAFSSAWEPSLTSLANGTLALAFIEFNLSASSINPYIANYIPNAFEFNTQSSRLVVTESYDGGLNWTTPSVLNSSVVNLSGNLLGWAPVRPWISAVGNTIYVAWENLTQSSLYPQSYYPNFGGGASIGAHLLVSTNGGASWGSTIDLPATPGLYYPFRTFVAMNPTVLAAPNGSVYVAFTTNVSAALPCGSICLQNPTTTGDVVVGVSQNNGTTFSWSTLSKTVALDPLWGPYYDPSPQLAVSPTNGQVYATYSAGLPGTYCFPGTFSFCAAAAYGTGVYFANSSDGGQRWSPVHLVDSTLVDSNGGPNDATYNPSLVVDAAGTIHLELSYSQYEPCSGTCILQKQLYYNSSDNGTTFGGGFTISGNYTYSPYEWDGEYDTMAVAGGHLWIAYVQDLCPAWSSSSCFMFGGGTGRAQVTIAMPFHGSGVTLTFSESGLPANSTWSVDMLGNVRSALAPASVAETGVPTGEWVNWSIPWVNVSYGAAFVGTIPASTSFVLGGATTIPVTFSELVRVDIATLPTFNQCYFGQCLNYLLPTLGVSWVPLGTVSTETVTPSVPPTFSQWLNVSFLGWVGSGNGSVTSNFTSVTFTANGPVNETASFLPNAVCSSYGTTTCTGGGTYDITFNETGLPSGVAWSVSADGVTGTSTTSTLDLAVPNGT